MQIPVFILERGPRLCNRFSGGGTFTGPGIFGPQRLTPGTEEGAPSSYALPDDGRTAEPAGFAFSSIHPQGMLESAGGPMRVYKGADGGPPGANGLAQDAAQAVVKPEKGLFSE